MKTTKQSKSDISHYLTGFDVKTQQKLQSRWGDLKHPEFFSDISAFWKKSIEEDFAWTSDILDVVQDYQGVYRRLFQLKSYCASPLLPSHTMFFLEQTNNKAVMAILAQRLDVLEACLNQEEPSQDTLEELVRLAALLGELNLVHYLVDTYQLEIDLEVLNMVLWSGQCSGLALKYFLNRCAPISDSLRYAILSQNIENVCDLIENYHVLPSSDYLPVAAGTGNHELFDVLLQYGVKPKGDLVFELAMHSKNDRIIQRLKNEFGYHDVGTVNLNL